MEVVAGEPQTETEVVQHKARFKLDFSKVRRISMRPTHPRSHVILCVERLNFARLRNCQPGVVT